MSDTSTSPSSASSSSASTSGSTSGGTDTTSGRQLSTSSGDSSLTSSQGRTTIADTVVSKIAGIATREVDGVHALGGGAARAVGQLRDRMPGSRSNLSQGVAVEVGDKEAAIDLDIVADYGVAIADLAAGIRRNVITAVERMTGLDVTEVNVTVHDVFLDTGEDDDQDSTSEDSAPRVQ